MDSEYTRLWPKFFLCMELRKKNYKFDYLNGSAKIPAYFYINFARPSMAAAILPLRTVLFLLKFNSTPSEHHYVVPERLINANSIFKNEKKKLKLSGISQFPKTVMTLTDPFLRSGGSNSKNITFSLSNFARQL
ncbi:hypothetical protein ACFP1I_20990 [Dyadobacter subterraneus]|uniref:Uncharacterized protein n=1 Tax=Dyadobacter subterraneus TaxID=2773304 RepID=A0ABR9WM92_9BACT|nr:hypothetical protein [Dyadobacter subterraneus]MBE9466655.1 hypothetical protein [Dyadobacter subterraneus]